MNDIFDVLNSVTSKCSVPLRKSISTNSYQYEFLRESVLWLQELQALNAKKQCSFINGWIQSINVILQLRQRLDEYYLPYLSTRNLCQDGLECFFGMIRFLQKFPDARSFTDNYAKIVSASLMRAPLSANCQTVDDQLELTVVHFLKRPRADDLSPPPLTLNEEDMTNAKHFNGNESVGTLFESAEINNAAAYLSGTRQTIKYINKGLQGINPSEKIKIVHL
ncbi:hypothetical protein FHG87_013961 [Trinorchestia longiramus]|nr:hypothetical protein FHG87_013961 [Trinorchestia longiramus]